MRGALPAYVRIAEDVARQINAGLLADGERLPTERAMAHQHGVAVGTLRKALARLTEQGLLERIHGSGNYVRRAENAGAVYAFFRLELPEGGGLPSAQLLDVSTLRKPVDLPEFGTARHAHRFRRLRFVGDVPAALEEIWLDGAAADHIDPAAVSESLYHFYREQLGIWIKRVEDWVGLAPVPGWDVDQFPLKPGAPAGFVERFGWDAAGRKLEYSRNWYDPARVRYVARLT